MEEYFRVLYEISAFLAGYRVVPRLDTDDQPWAGALRLRNLGYDELPAVFPMEKWIQFKR